MALTSILMSLPSCVWLSLCETQVSNNQSTVFLLESWLCQTPSNQSMIDSTEQQWQSSSKVVLTKYDRQLSIRNMKNFLRFWSLGGWLDTSELDKLKTTHDFDCYFHWRQLVQMAGLGHRGTKINFNALVSAILKSFTCQQAYKVTQ